MLMGSKSAAGRLFGIPEAFSAAGYRRAARPARPKLDPFIPNRSSKTTNVKKQRHTAKRIHARLRAEHGFTGGITIVTDVRRSNGGRGRCLCRCHMRQARSSGFWHAWRNRFERSCTILRCRYRMDAFFMKAYPAETTEAFCDRGFCLLRRGAVVGTYDHRDRRSKDPRGFRTRVFSELQSQSVRGQVRSPR